MIDEGRRGRVRAAAAEAVQRGLRRLGYELRRTEPRTRFRPEDLRRTKLLRSHAIDLVLDVGANAGQYARRLRRAGYDGAICSFEPLAEPYSELRRRSVGDPLWRTHQLALGETDGTAEMHRSANLVSSSMLKIAERHVRSDPGSESVATESVSVARLDTIWDEVVADARRIFLKLDVQGFELPALRGAAAHLPLVAAVQAELSLVPLYEGHSRWQEIAEHLESRGFELAGLEPGFEDPDTGELLQADGIFVRRGRA